MYNEIKKNLKESNNSIDFNLDLLMAVFGGGTADWDMISKCEYDAEDIIERVKEYGDFESADFNTLLGGAIDLYRYHIQDALEEVKGSVEDEEERAKLEELDPYTDIDAYTNYLDTSMFFSSDVDDEKKELYEKYLRDAIDAEDEKIGFCYLSTD